MVRTNHLIDPTYFFDAIDEFTFEYTAYIYNNAGVDEYGNTKRSFTKQQIFGSLQIQNKAERKSKDGNTADVTYRFYSKSLYRLNFGDVIEYDGMYLRVNDVKPYNEFGVREVGLVMIQLSAYRDFAEYIKVVKGEQLI